MVDVVLAPWAPEHLPLLTAANTPGMTRFMGGPEPAAHIPRRHERYLAATEPGGTRMFAIVADRAPLGGVGYWPVEHDGEPAYETGWHVVPAWHGRGVARAAVRALVATLRAERAPERRMLFAYPSIENAASNALCRSVGFTALRERDFPFRGVVLRTRVWMLDLDAPDPLTR
ncbi:GNAT family N-acetyltransferase [Microbacterium sp. GXF7504]